MKCSACGHGNDHARFCIKCGAALQPEVRIEAGPAAPESPETAKDHLRQAKQASRQYFSYFAQVLRYPLQTAQNVRREQLVNGIISIVLIALLYPLLVYFMLNRVTSAFGGHPSFGKVVVGPFFFFLIAYAFIAAVIYGVVRIWGGDAGYKDVAARFGTLLIPAVASVFVACLAVLLGIGITFFFSLSLIFLFVAIIMSVLSFDRPNHSGLDTVYGIVLAVAFSGYMLYRVVSWAAGSFFGGGFLY